MSADPPKYHESPKQTRGDPHLVTPQEVTDPSILESVAGFINDVVPTAYATPYDITDQIQWAHFEQLEFDELGLVSNTDCEKIVPPPLVLVLGYSTGIQVWCIAANGEATEIISWRHGSTKVLRILPSPHEVDGNCNDLFASKRPLMALCDSASPGPPHCALSFLSLKTGEQVKLIKFKNTILDVRGNKRSVVVSFSEKIAVFDAFTLEDRCTVTTCYLSPGIQPNPISLGSRWLAYAEKTLAVSKKSSGGCDSEGVQSYKATVIQCAKSLGKGIKEFGESVANSITGSSNFKPGVVCPGSPQSGGPGDGCQKGVVTILDIECNQMRKVEKTIPVEAIIAHFIAHNEAIVSLEFDTSGLLLLTADRRGHDFHVFRIYPHPVGSYLASVHHLYILHRGDTTAKVQDMCFSPDSRWVTVSTLRGTTHVFPITSYGGHVGVRTHTTQHVVNKMSRFHRSAGLTGEERSNSPVSGLENPSGNVYPYVNPRFPPYPHPTIINPLAQIRQPIYIQTPGSIQPRPGNTRQRLSSSSEDSISLRVVACFAAPRAYMDSPTPQETAQKKVKAVESLFVMGCHGSLIQYDLDPQPIQGVPKEKICDDTPIDLKTAPKAQWVLQRPSNAVDVPLPLKSKYLKYFIPNVTAKKTPDSEQNDDHWLSQVEIVTHAGPHRRLWMGPQFTFKTYTTTTAGCPFSLSNVQQLDIGRSKPVNMPVTQNAVFIECGSANSRELSPPMNTYHATFDEISGLGDMQLKEDLADAMLESPGIREAGGRCVIVSMKPQATPVAKVVNPLGTVVTVQSDEETEKEQCEDAVIHENCDEALFRPIVAPKPILFSEGKPRTNATDTMLIRSLDDTTGMAVKILPKTNNTTDENVKHIKDNKSLHQINEPKASRRSLKKYAEKPKIEEEQIPLPITPDILDSSNISKDIDVYPFAAYDVETEPNFAEVEAMQNIESGSIFKETCNNYKDDFPRLGTKYDERVEMFEDASDCYNDLLYAKPDKEYGNKKDNVIAEEKAAPVKPRKPKTKLGVRIPNKNFPLKDEVDTETSSVFWNNCVSETEIYELIDVPEDRTSKKTHSPNMKNVKLIHIETPAEEDAAIEIIEPVTKYRKNNWDSIFLLEKSFEVEKIIDGSPGETTESDDSGKLPENQIPDFISESVIQTVSKTAKKKSKKKRK